MRALYIYNPYSIREVELIERAKGEMSTYIDVIPINETPDMVKNYIRTTPALIIVNDDLQGDGLLAESTDGKLLATAMLYKRLQEEELAIYQQETHRLDNMINIEKAKAIDTYTLELIEGGLL